MHINFAFFLVIFFVIKDYAHKEKKTETSEGHRQISVAHSQTWLDETLAFANCLDPQAAERASLKDKQFLGRLKDAMAEATTAPWRCHWCRRLNKYFATKCGSCYLSWEKCIDIHYVHGQKQQSAGSPRASSRKKWPQSSNWDQWGSSETPLPSRLHHPGNAPRPRRRRKSRRATMVHPHWTRLGNWQSSAPAPVPPQTLPSSTGSAEANIYKNL